MDIAIRPETAADNRTVEEITREAFWNHHVPGCDEHYLAHVMRDHEDFVPELDFVALADGRLRTGGNRAAPEPHTAPLSMKLNSFRYSIGVREVRFLKVRLKFTTS
jgi:hypothetical protein